MAIPAILKGDTSSSIILAIASGYDYTGCTLAVVFNGVRKEFTGLVAGGTKSLQYTADETAGMPLGTGHATLTLTNAAGVVRTMPWTRIRVTDIPSELYDRNIDIDPSQLDVTDATTADSLGAVKNKLNAVLAFLRGGASCVAFFLGLSCFGSIGPTTVLNDVPGDTTISNLVVASGVETGGGGGITANDATNAAAAVVVRDVPSWARQANPPAAMADNALVLTNGAVKTKDGGSTVTAAQVGARASDWMPTAADVGAIGTNKLTSGMTWARYSSNWMNGTLAFGNTGTLQLNNTAKVWFINPAQVKVGAGLTWELSPTLLSWMNTNESDPTVPSWAKAASKPTYTAAEVGARPNNWMPTAAEVGAISEQALTNTALRVASRTWDAGYQILWEKQANLGGFYEVCVTNVSLEVQQ